MNILPNAHEKASVKENDEASTQRIDLTEDIEGRVFGMHEKTIILQSALTFSMRNEKGEEQGKWTDSGEEGFV